MLDGVHILDPGILFPYSETYQDRLSLKEVLSLREITRQVLPSVISVNR